MFLSAEYLKIITRVLIYKLMSEHYLSRLFEPRSIAVIGASNQSASVGTKVFNNLLQSFAGKLYPVNPKYKEIQGNPCFTSVKDINQPIDLAVIVTPANTVPQIIAECGTKQISYAVIISAGFSETDETGNALEQQIIEHARKHHIRFVGPNCLGIMRSNIGLNATFSNNFAANGKLAFVSQSGALCAAILDWATAEKFGFSTVVSLGNGADINFSEVLDYLALDNQTDGILLYIEGLRHASSFVANLRAATRLKPVIAMKAGRNLQGSQAALSHTAAMMGSDEVFTAALHQTGTIRIMSTEQLFSAIKVFSSHHCAPGNRLLIVTNGGGAGVIAADHATDLAIELPKATAESSSNHRLRHNPIDILGDATPTRYHEVITTCLNEENYDGLLVILVPVAMSQPLEVAQQLVKLNEQTDMPVLACWMGKRQVKSSRELFIKNNIPCFATPEAAIDAFFYLASYHSKQQFLQKASEPTVYQDPIDTTSAYSIINTAISKHRTLLTTIESKAILKAFGIPTTQTIAAQSVEDALAAAKLVGFPIAMKINSPDITHKKDVGGVKLNITQVDEVAKTYIQMINEVKKKCPQAKILGVTIEPMYKTPYDRELIVGISHDLVFGPIISFGAGGTAVEIWRDYAMALPPLNSFLAYDLIQRTRVSKLLAEFRHMPAANLTVIQGVLLKVSRMTQELPQIKEMDINPLIANDKEVVAVDARIVLNL